MFLKDSTIGEDFSFVCVFIRKKLIRTDALCAYYINTQCWKKKTERKSGVFDQNNNK